MSTVKELLNEVSVPELIELIQEKYGTVYREDCFSIVRAYSKLTNKNNEPVDPSIREKYSLDLMIAINKKAKPNAKTLDDIIIAHYYALRGKGNRHYNISSRYVKNLQDFGLCEVSGGESDLSSVERAVIMILSFSVLCDEIKEAFEGDITPLEYILDLKNREPFDPFAD